MTVWFVLALMTAAAIFVVLWPLGRQATLRTSGSDIEVYQDQLREIVRDRSAGLIGAAEADAARVEVSRRILAAADSGETPAAKAPSSAATWRRRFAAVTTLVALPIGAIAFYLMLGSPGLPDQPLAARTDEPPGHRSLASMLVQVENHLERNPNDGRGWQVVSPIYMRLGRFDDAVTARRNSLRLLGSTAEREADLGEALVAAANGIVTAEAKAKASFDRSVALAPGDPRARYFIGLAAEQDGNAAHAGAIWRELLANAPGDAQWARFVRQALARLEGETTPAAPGPTSQDVAAASELSADERSQMVRGMVDRLAERLKHDGSDLEGWARLVRAYTVLGDREKAANASTDARRVFAADPDKLHQLDDLLKAVVSQADALGGSRP